MASKTIGHQMKSVDQQHFKFNETVADTEAKLPRRKAVDAFNTTMRLKLQSFINTYSLISAPKMRSLDFSKSHI